MSDRFAIQRLRMLDTSLAVLYDELVALREWTALELKTEANGPASDEAQRKLDDIDVPGLLLGMSSAILLFADSRNEYAEETELNISEMIVNFSHDTYADRAETED